jgi:hypothetical protein
MPHGLVSDLLDVWLWDHSVNVPLMRFFPSFAAHELMQVSDEAAIFRDGDRYPGFQRNFSIALKAERMCFLRE